MFDLVLSVRRVAKKILHYVSFTENFAQSEDCYFKKHVELSLQKIALNSRLEEITNA